jgi:putative flippase GtrA
MEIQARKIIKKYRKFIFFCISGGGGYVVNAISLHYLSFLYINELVIWALSTFIAMLAVFILNSILTFKDIRSENFSGSVKRFFVFLGSSTGAFIIQSVAGPILVSLWGEQYRQYILVFVIICFVAPYNWYMYNRLVWKK